VIPTITGFLGAALLLAGAACLVPARSRSVRAAIVLAAGASALIPVQGTMIAEYLRGALGDLSIVTQALLAIGIAQHVAGSVLIARRERAAIMATVVLGALFLYPAALGVAYLDPYSLGYGSAWLTGGLLVLALAAWQLRFEWLVALLLIAVIARLANVLESRNLWDYLLDPLLALYAVLWLIRAGLQARPALLNRRA
jgi:hypothetical protein